ncbi:MAG: glycosyltransferase family 2 protein [Methanosphaera stadtmanae]|nr:glycosyltransferase family 2 protein [Methanosphaera stadtmanae]
MVKVSVVLPVYNVENYLRDCLDSIVNQTLKDIEIICINDGSPDNSLEILREYEAKDNRITVIDQENGGHAVATNRGLKLATGECLFSMDSDDILELNALELSYNRLKEKDVDFVMFKAINYNDTNDVYYESEVYSMNKIYAKVGDEVFNYHDIGELMFESCVTPWNKLYKREFIIENNIHYPEGLIFEDNVFYYNALLTAKRICFLNEFLFIRRWYATSSTTNGDLRFLDSISVTNLINEVFKEKGEFDNFKSNLLNNKINLNYMRYTKIKKEFKETYFKAMKNDFLAIIEDNELYEDLTEVLDYRNKKIFEHVIISENCVELDLLRNIYDKQMKNYHLFNSKHLFKDYIKTSIDNYLKLNDKNKEHYFNSMKENFIEIISKEGFYEEIMRNTSYKYQKLFEQVIISENYIEFEELREIYNIQMNNYDLMNDITNPIVSLLDYRLTYANKSNQKELFDDCKNFLTEVVSDDSAYEFFFNIINYSNQKIFNQIIISENKEEYTLLRKIYDSKMNMKSYKSTLKNKTENYEKVKDFNNQLINSNSWKLTKIFRKI